MKKIIIIASLAASFCGCQTRITAEKNAEVAHPIQSVVKVNGTNQVVTTGYMVTSGGWYATARSPLWADEAMKGLNIAVSTNGTVSLSLDDYSRDLSTNAVAMTKVMCDAASDITAKVTAAIVTHGGSVAAGSTQSAISTLVSNFIKAGGDAKKATVTCEDGSCSITDGSVICTDGSCYPR